MLFVYIASKGALPQLLGAIACEEIRAVGQYVWLQPVGDELRVDGVLKDYARWSEPATGLLARLREQTEPNIDDLLSIVTESVAAYKVCKERIDAVEKALQAALTDVGGGAPPSDDGDDGDDGSEPVPRRAQAKPAAKKPGTGFDAMDDDVPF